MINHESFVFAPFFSWQTQMLVGGSGGDYFFGCTNAACDFCLLCDRNLLLLGWRAQVLRGGHGPFDPFLHAPGSGRPLPTRLVQLLQYAFVDELIRVAFFLLGIGRLKLKGLERVSVCWMWAHVVRVFSVQELQHVISVEKGYMWKCRWIITIYIYTYNCHNMCMYLSV